MWIKEIEIENYRTFQEKFNMTLSKNITVISGLNGVGKSTILAILTNASELKSKKNKKENGKWIKKYKPYKTLNGSPFRGDFADVIMFDKDFDSPGYKTTVFFSDLPENQKLYNVKSQVKFRASIHSGHITKRTYRKLPNQELYKKSEKKVKIKRYRLIPEKADHYNNERKVKWPSYYMGLSRLSPLGEKDRVTPKSIPEKLIQEIIKIHKEILSEYISVDESKMTNLDIGNKYPKSTINSGYYGYASNSNGQDNTGQIIEAVLSFQLLKQNMQENGDKYVGGILAIDELDATLHPAAQNKMFDWLLDKSKELDLQIVFTTHSLTLLEHISKLQLKDPDCIKVNYLSKFSDDPGYVKIKENPKPEYYKHNLQQTYVQTPIKKPKIYILSEDETTRWFAQQLIEYTSNSDYSLEWLNVNISWSHLLNLYNSNPSNFSDYIILLDPDLNMELENSPLNEYIKKHIVQFKVNSSLSNIFILPGNESIETLIWNYVHSLKASNLLFDDPNLANYGINYDTLRNIDKNGDYINDEKHKKWFKDNNPYMDTFIKYWIKDNIKDVKKFMGIFSSAYARIIKNLSD
ncbi:AAA family ATPase [Limosilactobacillus sp. RRLNB_1_1]|uniref:AAA family ATPase n=1 Tax=Limosilactobacillus albertensis TaxID=2759752 RepID=A0A7W3TQU6_9LACO|nr:AAA family ATPase [Limosilactobacillus albertensis]MBB1069227.1 AAA family ATPase [Limosilactobacillus albertensis]MCD7118475.1 AAA family ATPase [Limosilactobacillus albertensis]MCD7128618.1 AAA family ATPase [Limosilactobacillus albertensis]